MQNRRHLTATLVALVSLLIAGCAGGSGATTSSEPPISDATVVVTDVSSTSTTEAVVTAPPTTLPDPTIFNAERVGDPYELSSFVITLQANRVVNGTPDVRTTTKGYIRDPQRAFVVSDYGENSTSTWYLIDGALYENDHQGYWYLYANGSLTAPNILDTRFEQDAMYGVISATFVGEEVFDGIPAYHFTFDETNLERDTSGDTETDAVGDFFLAKEGNHVLYAHSRTVTAGEGFEFIDEYTTTMSSVNALAEITLPAEMVPLREALDLGTLLGIPMPADATLDSMINYNDGGIGVYYYQFTSTWQDEIEFLDFYRSLPPTNGWSVTHVGQVKDLDVHCSDGNCVIIESGDKQVILYFDGSYLHADWDREHRFGPCTNPQSASACG